MTALDRPNLAGGAFWAGLGLIVILNGVRLFP